MEEYKEPIEIGQLIRTMWEDEMFPDVFFDHEISGARLWAAEQDEYAVLAYSCASLKGIPREFFHGEELVDDEVYLGYGHGPMMVVDKVVLSSRDADDAWDHTVWLRVADQDKFVWITQYSVVPYENEAQ